MNNTKKIFSVILSIFLCFSIMFVFSCKEPEVPTSSPGGDNPQEEETPKIVDAVVPTIKSQPQNVTVSSGQNFTLSVVASVSDGGSLSYQWYKADDDISVGAKIDNATSAEFTSSYELENGESQKTFYYYVVVVNTNNKVNGTKTSSVTSNYATVSVNNKVNAVIPLIQTQPSSFTGEKPDSLSLSVVATVSDGGNLTYQWYKSANATSEGTKISEATSSIYQIPDSDLEGTWYYYCVVSNTIQDNGDGGVKVQSVKSNYVTITIQEEQFNPEPNPGVQDPDPTFTPSEKSGVMLQGFNWGSAPRTASSHWGKWYNVMLNNADTIGDKFSYVWCPPPSKCDTASSEGYCPTELNVLDNCYGTANELKQMIQAISPAKAIADIVVNHRSGSTSWGDFTNPDWGVVKGSKYGAICSNDEGFTKEPDLMGKATVKGASDTGEGYEASRDVDHTNTTVQQGIVDWMNDVLKLAGFVGWRYDYVKGFDGKYVGQYNAGSNAEFSVGEYWPTAGYNSGNPSAWGNEIKNWISETASNGGQKSKAFDFALKGAMNSIFGCTWFDENWNGGSSGASNNYGLLADSSNLVISQPADAVTFVENHDTGSTQNHWALNTNAVGIAYAFILTHPGYPCVAWQHYFTYAESGSYDSEYYSKIKASTTYIANNIVPGTSSTYREHIDYLIDLRNRVGIEYDDKVVTTGTTSSCYVGEIVGNNGTLLVKIGNVTAATGEGYAGNNPIYSGTNFAIWEKGVNGDASLPSGGNSGGSGSGDSSRELIFTRPNEWGDDMFAHFWNTNGDITSWPGNQMTWIGQNEYGQHQFTIAVPEDATFVIFTDNSGKQTVNISLSENVTGYYITGESSPYEVGSW